MFDPLFDGLAGALAFFYELWPSYGGAIVLFTIAIMLVLSPLAIKSTRSMIRMMQLAPEMKKLQVRYKDDRESLNREMMAFYQANSINPFSSCLPLLLQMPVFIVLFHVLQGLTRKGSDGTFNPKYLDEDSSLYQALSGSTEMLSFGMDLSKSALTELRVEGLITALPFFFLVVIVAGTQWYQQRQIAGRRGEGAPAITPQQQMLQRVLPFIIVPFALSFPAGLVVYYVTSNLVRIGQQALVTQLEVRRGTTNVIVPEPSGPTESKDGTPKGSGTPSPRPPSGRVTNPGRSNQRKKRRK